MQALSKKLNEFSFTLSPPESISKMAKFWKAEVENIIGHSFEDRFYKPHISLMKANRDEDFLYELDRRVQLIRPFTVSIKDFNAFKHGAFKRTIYLEIVRKAPIWEVFEILNGSGCYFTPHLTIAKNLGINDYTRIWSYFKNLSYSCDFVCDHVTVRKWLGNRMIHYTDLYFASKPSVCARLPVGMNRNNYV